MAWLKKSERNAFLEMRVSELEAEVAVLKKRHNEHVRETYRPHLVPEGVYYVAIEGFDKITTSAAGAFKRGVRLRVPQYTTPIWAMLSGYETTLRLLEYADWTNVRVKVRVTHREHGYGNVGIQVHILDVA